MTAAADAQMATARTYPWWLVLLQGISLVIIGILLFTNTGITTVVLVTFLGIYWIISGIFSIISIFTHTSNLHWGWLLFSGVISIIAGILIWQHPLWATVVVLRVAIIVLGLQGIIVGCIGIWQALKGAGWGPGILGAVSIAFGLILLFNNMIAAAALPWVIGIFALAGGVIAIWQSFQVRKLEHAEA